MKYVVKLTYTNPAHEHVTLRRRVDTVNRIVEAASEEEALNRAANQQRALGFKIQEAAIVEQEKAPVKTEQLTEASKEGSMVMRGMRAALKSMDLRHGVDSDKRDAGYKMSPAVKAAQAKSDVLSKVVKSPQAGTLAAAKLRKEEVEYIEEKLSASDPVSKWISDFVKSDNPKFAGKSKKERIRMALGAHYAAKRGNVEEGYDPSSAEIAKMLVKKHGAGNVTKQHILDMEADRDSRKALDHDEIMKHVKKMTEEVESVNEGATRWEYSGTVNGKDYTITVPRGADLSDHLGHKKIQRENPHLEPHEVKAVADTSGEDEEHVEVEHEGKKYTHHVTNNQEPKMVYSEEVELDEANMRFDPEAAARPKSSDVKNFLNRGKNARSAAASKKYIRRMTKLGGLGPNQTKKDTEAHMKAHFEEVELDEAQKKLKPSYWKAEWRLGTQSEVDKNNKKIFDKLAKTDPVKAAAFHDNLMRMKKKDVKEEVEQTNEGLYGVPFPKQWKKEMEKVPSTKTFRGKDEKGVYTSKTVGGKEVSRKYETKEEVVTEANTRVVNKEVKKEKAAETAVAAARRAKNSKNKVETEPKIDMDVVGSEKKYVTKV